MLTLRRTIGRHPVYFIAFILFVIIASVTIAVDNKVDCFIRLNPFHERVLDLLFMGMTFLGDGVFSLLMAASVMLFWKDIRLGIHIVAAYVLSGLAAQLLKKCWAAPRPRSIITHTMYKNFIEGVSGTGNASFPSGHTTSIFALATILALHASNKAWGMFFFFMALLVAYSRIYLGQHFLPDVTAGAILGTLTGILVYSFINLRKRTANKNTVLEESSEEAEYASNLAGH